MDNNIFDSKSIEEKEKEEIEKTNNLLNEYKNASKNTYKITGIYGKGAFGVVYKAVCNENNKNVAIKFVLQKKQFTNRELMIMKDLNHPNIIKLLDSFYIPSKEKEDEQYLNCVMESLPETLNKICRNLYTNHMQMDELSVKLYSFQILRAINYLHSLGICHRDLTPTNILVNPTTHIIKICDFGSAKIISNSQSPSSCYVCARFYRAPELIFGQESHSFSIDMWSFGAILAELVLGRPLFAGRDASEQLVEIIKVLGSPNKEEIRAMNEKYVNMKIPEIKKLPWEKVFKNKKIPHLFYDLLDKSLIFDPNKRIKAKEALNHPFFDDLINLYKNQINLNNNIDYNKNMHDIFDFTEQEKENLKEICDKFKF